MSQTLEEVSFSEGLKQEDIGAKRIKSLASWVTAVVLCLLMGGISEEKWGSVSKIIGEGGTLSALGERISEGMTSVTQELHERFMSFLERSDADFNEEGE